MEYRRLGQSGLKLSALGLGSWLTYGNATSDATAVGCIRRAYAQGINFFDTANAYARGAAEEVVGKVLADFPRDELVIATKVFFPMGEGPNDRGLSRKHVMEQCHHSLRRLRVSYIDLYQCHRYDGNTPLQETLRALDDLVRQGKVLYVGVSEWHPEQIEAALQLADGLLLDRIVSNQPRYSMLHRAVEQEVFPVCRRLGVGQVVFSPLAQGLLTGKYHPGQHPPPDSRAADPQQNQFLTLEADVLSRIQRLPAIASRAGLSLTQLALAWCLRREEVSSVIIGASRPSQIDENVQAVGKRLPYDILQQIDNVLI